MASVTDRLVHLRHARPEADDAGVNRNEIVYTTGNHRKIELSLKCAVREIHLEHEIVELANNLNIAPTQ